jgi:Cu(I)/Ag(I) efflux system membrane fusion protein
LAAAGCGGKKSAPAATPGAAALSSSASAAVTAALPGYEKVRVALAGDRLPDATEAASNLAAALEKAEGGNPAETSLLAGAGRAATAIAGAADLAPARQGFADLSRNLIGLIGRSPKIRGKLYLYFCPMAEGYARWVQTEKEPGNPYMGTRMPRCANPVSWEKEGAALVPGADSTLAATPAAAGGDAIAYYTCPMHTSVRQPEPGHCPICGMELVPVTREEIATGVILIDPERRQRIGIRTARVMRRPLTTTVRAAGRVVVDQTRLTDVSLKVGGWIGELDADEPGMRIERGKPLFTLYSPELLSAQEEYLTALASQARARDTVAPDRADYLVDAARRRLELWDLTGEQIDALARRGASERYVPILSPISGYLVEKNVVAGGAVTAGERLLRLAGLDRIWIEADVYESEFPLVGVGRPAVVELPYLPGRRFEGTVSFVYPYLDPDTRTGRVRITLSNPDLILKPDMVASVEIATDLGDRLVVPESAVIRAGTKNVVFLDLGNGRLKPRRVTLGAEAGDEVEILSGLDDGDLVVASGNFLVASESRLKTALENW